MLLKKQASHPIVRDEVRDYERRQTFEGRDLDDFDTSKKRKGITFVQCGGGRRIIRKPIF